VRNLRFSSLRGSWICAIWAVVMGVGTPPIAHAEPNRIRVEYVLPSNPAHQALYEMLQERRALEKFQEIFSPFRLPIVLTLKTVGCDGVSNAYYQRPELKICYEYLDDIRKSMPKETTEAGVTPMDAVVGQFFYAVAHEMGHAVFDLYDVPLFGRPEDAADQFAAYIMLQFGKDQARRLIGGAAYSYKNFVSDPKYVVSLEAFSNTHGAPAQRFYNLLCIAYGADSKLFADVVEKGYLPQKRAATCRAEYREVAFAFKQLIAPHLDQELVKQALDKAWMPEPGPSSVHK
jgi:Putative metallopeptidase